jgi:Conjugal transfer protein TraD
LHWQLIATLAALGRNRAARNRQQAARARYDMRNWQIGCRKRTRHLIELGGLVVKARVVELTGDDRATILGALLWMADKLQSDQGEYAHKLWTEKGKRAFVAGRQRTTGQIELFQQFVVDGRKPPHKGGCLPRPTFHIQPHFLWKPALP